MECAKIVLVCPAGRHDRPWSGKPAIYPVPELRQRILKQLEARLRQGCPAGTAERWRKHSVFRTTLFGVFCARKASNFGGIGRGA